VSRDFEIHWYATLRDRGTEESTVPYRIVRADFVPYSMTENYNKRHGSRSCERRAMAHARDLTGVLCRDQHVRGEGRGEKGRGRACLLLACIRVCCSSASNNAQADRSSRTSVWPTPDTTSGVFRILRKGLLKLEVFLAN